NASDGDGIQRVEFYDGPTKLGQDTTAPFEFTWNYASRGAHALSAIAIDAVGNSAQSALVNVSVQGAPLPSPWLHDDIGNVGIAGDASFGGGIFNVSGSGDDIWGDADAFHFVHRQLTGDGEIIARVTSLQNTDSWAKVGVMMRESLAADSAYAFSILSAGNGDAFQRRGATAAGAEHNAGQGASAPFWVRLVRAGDTFTAYSSPINGDWQAIGSQTIPMESTIYVGLAVTAHNNGALNGATFSDVTVGSSGNVAPTVTLTQPANGARFVDVPAINFAATASDSDGSVARMEFLVDGAIVGQSIVAPYASGWSSPSYGTHTLGARAVDNSGAATTTSATITVENTGAAGFRAEYYDNIDFTGFKFIRTDATIDFDWGGGPPDSRVAPDTFSVRWSGRIRPRFSETYTFTTTTDDGVRLWVNGQLIIDKWVNQGATNWSGTLPLVADQSCDVVMEYFENGGDSSARLRWSSASQPTEAIPASRTTVPNPVNQPPVVTLTAPADGATFLDTDTISLSATANDPDGYVSRVEFWANGAKLGQTGGAPFTLPWSGLHGIGAYSLTAHAVDTAGTTASTSAIVVQTIPLGLTPASVLHLTSPDRMVSTLHFAIPVSRSYAIEWSDDLITWHPLTAGISTGAPIDYTDTALGVTRRFFRLLVN
ncbi:MAG: Ig-like domain-containing protein, partial [Luteolibacter sp.]